MEEGSERSAGISRRQALRVAAGLAAGLSAGALRLPSLQASQGPGRRGRRGMEPFRVDFPRARIEDLHRRIDAMLWPEMPFDTGWSAGTDDGVLRDLVEHWRHRYDWFTVQAEMNRQNHLRGPVGGDQLHCVLHEADGGGRLPLLLLHGWPGSFHEFNAAAPLLAAGVGGGPRFDVVVPSLPGFAFSDAPREPGMNPALIAERLHLLMRELGYDRYGVQGGDWGAIIGTQIARRYPESVAGLHLNFVASAPPPPEGVPASEAEQEYRRRRARFQAEETGYSAIQGTRPQTLAYALQDSPVGWLAWMVEKYWAWSDHGGDLWSVFRRDDLLTTAMLYWLPGRVLSASRIYHENRTGSGSPGGRVEVPTGYARFPAEPWSPPREVVARSYNLVHYAEPPRGGHFPALEQPALWTAEVARFFSTVA